MMPFYSNFTEAFFYFILFYFILFFFLGGGVFNWHLCNVSYGAKGLPQSMMVNTLLDELSGWFTMLDLIYILYF